MTDLKGAARPNFEIEDIKLNKLIEIGADVDLREKGVYSVKG
jgi:hypothetical protein